MKDPERQTPSCWNYQQGCSGRSAFPRGLNLTTLANLWSR